MIEKIFIKGARQHNLKGIDVTIPRNKFVVITGLSGSGKSSLAFDTLYAEGQRRYVESLSSYARQFLDRMQKPEIEHIEGLSPAISIEQRSANANPRSTVSTTTEIYDYLRLLYAHIGIPQCPTCGVMLEKQSAQNICNKLLSYPENKKMMILAPYVRGKKGEHKEIIETIKKDGFVRIRIDNEIVTTDEPLPVISKNKKHTIEAVVDRLITGKCESGRLNDSIELALKHGNGIINVLIEDTNTWKEELLSENLACLKCNLSFGEILPRNFSFNSPYGACPTCHGLGTILKMSPELVVPDTDISLKKGAVPGWRRGPRRLLIYYNHILKCIAEHCNFPELTKVPFKQLPDHIQKILLYGSGDEVIKFDYWRRGKIHKISKPFEGILENLKRRYHETESDSVRERLRSYMTRCACPSCNGARLRPESLAVKIGGLSIHDFNKLSIDKAYKFITELKLNSEEIAIAGEVIQEIKGRILFLQNVGLSYMTLNRESGTLSGGEAQRIRLATQLGCGLVGVLYILDEPSIGLHQKDNINLLNTLKKLKDMGNTVIVVEHDLETILCADYIIDLGPGAGHLGGELVFAGAANDIVKCEASLTGQFISGRKSIPIPAERKIGIGKNILIEKAGQHNLKDIDVTIPLGTLCCVTGVSGSGKSTLINDVLKKEINRRFKIGHDVPGVHKAINGLENIDKMIVIDQKPIGRTPRSNPATYTDVFTAIRNLFAQVPEAKMRGYKPGRFSFNIKGGRCEDCKGDGVKKIEMHFLPDVHVICSSCNGKRFNDETLNIRYKKKNIAEVLDMTVNEAYDFFKAIPKIYRKLKTLKDVGLGYIHLGQPATTLSGGEAQRVKLAAELSKVPRGHTLYILDEPTTGLHLADIEYLLDVLMKLRDQGNTVLIIEHNLDVVKTADYIIDLGPEGGDKGGEVIAYGTPEEIVENKRSYTGQFLIPLLA